MHSLGQGRLLLPLGPRRKEPLQSLQRVLLAEGALSAWSSGFPRGLSPRRLARTQLRPRGTAAGGLQGRLGHLLAPCSPPPHPSPAASPPQPAVEGSSARAHCALAARPVGSPRRAGGGNVGRRGAAHLQPAAGDAGTSRPRLPPRSSEKRLGGSGKRSGPGDPVGGSCPSAAPKRPQSPQS